MLFFVPENPPEKAKKSKKLTITEKNPPKKPPHISEKVLFAPSTSCVVFGLVSLAVTVARSLATSYSPRCSPMCWIRHWRRTWGNLTKYNVAHWSG